MNIDLKPQARDISLCTQEFCPIKCRRWHENWKPAHWQSYIQPSIKYNKNGKIEKCKLRMEE